MQNTTVQQVLKAWQLAETISNGEINNGKWLADETDYVRIDRLRSEFDSHMGDKKGLDSVVYFGEYSKQDIRDEIQKKFFADCQFVTNPDSAVGYCLAVFVNPDWTLKKTFIPDAAYFYFLLSQSYTPQQIACTFTEKNSFKEFRQQIEEQLTLIFSNRKKSIGEILCDADEVVRHHFKLRGNSRTKFRGLLNYKKEPALLNSFYLNDIQRVLESGFDNKMIQDYILGVDRKHLDIDKNWKFISKLVTTDNMPDGRWPGAIEYSQSLMQQVAVNIIRDKADNSDCVRTVNGPPGTGKTTLLKDVFADLIVSQAKEFAKLDKPHNGFIQIGQVYLYPNQKHPYKAYELIPSLQGYGVVVTSNNNSAVANITRDFPAKREINQYKDEGTSNRYQEELEKIDYFSDIANEILDRSDAWGLFSAQLGAQEKTKKVYQSLNRKTEDKNSRIGAMLNDAAAKDTWIDAKANFNDALNRVTEVKVKLKQKIERVNSYNPQKKMDIKNELATLNLDETRQKIASQNEYIEKQQQALSFLPKKRFLFWTWDTPQRKELKQSIGEAYLVVAKAQIQVSKDGVKADRLKKELIKQEQLEIQIEEMVEQLKNSGTLVGNEIYWKKDSNEVQIDLPNNSAELQDARAELFIAAIRLRKAFLAHNSRQISNACRIMENEKSGKLVYPQDEGILRAAFQIMQVLIPVISTTLASVQSMFANFGEDSIDQVVIDEAGQATPASAIGIMWRAKRLVALGDPAQIEPVVTTSEPTLRIIARDYGVDERYLLPQTSVQQLADNASYYGTYRSDGSWVGVPLWVHRRCISPMFEIANEISYEGRMVQGTKGKTKIQSAWLDSSGKAQNDQFVKEQVEVVAKSIRSLLTENKDISLRDIYIISPFNAVVNGFRSGLKVSLKNLVIDKNWFDQKKGNIGTVHTFQGKAAKVVYFVIGTDENTDGAADWAFSKPNLLNVAATRAKKAFFIVGDHKRLSNKPFVSVADKELSSGKIR